MEKGQAKGHRFAQGVRLPRDVVVMLKRETVVVADSLPAEVRRALENRGWITRSAPDEPVYLTVHGWRSIASSDARVHANRSVAAVKRHGADPYQVAANEKARHARYRAKHMPVPFKVRVEGWIDACARDGAAECPRDGMPLAGTDLLWVRHCDGMLAAYGDGGALVGPLDATGAVLRPAAKYARTAWRLLGRGLLRAERVSDDGGVLTVRFRTTESGAQVVEAALTVEGVNQD